MLHDERSRVFRWTDAQIAIISGSHFGEIEHVRLVRSILEKGAFPESSLLCGPESPKDPEAAAALIRAGRGAGPLHNTCSGEHAGLLAYASLFSSELAYTDLQHPLHERCLAYLSQVFDTHFARISSAIDDCNLPTRALPLRSLALGFSRLANPSGLQPDIAAPLDSVREAMTRQPYYVGGRLSLDTRLISSGIIAKSGTEAVLGLGIKLHGEGASTSSIGVAIKVLDGSPRSLGCVALQLLEELGAMTPEIRRALESFTGPIRNASGVEVGRFILDRSNLRFARPAANARGSQDD